jgi:hypothetical protein
MTAPARICRGQTVGCDEPRCGRTIGHCACRTCAVTAHILAIIAEEFELSRLAKRASR